MMSNRAGTRLEYLDIYKGICSLCIIITHYFTNKEMRKVLLFPFWIDMAVPVFMVITGYLYSLNYGKKTISDLYRVRRLMRKCIRFVIPFMPILVIEVIINLCIYKIPLTEIMRYIYMYGGYGPGSYYFVVMIQIIFLMPIVVGVIEKFEHKGLILLFSANVLFEIIKYVLDMQPWVYRLCALRYIFILSFGVFLQHKNMHCENRILYNFVGAAGAVYILLFEYLPFKPLVTSQWTSTSVFAVMFIVPFMKYLIGPRKLSCKLLEHIGRASFNVFLIQMIYYWIFSNKVYLYVSSKIIRLGLNVFICTAVGIAYWWIERPITERVFELIEKTHE